MKDMEETGASCTGSSMMKDMEETGASCTGSSRIFPGRNTVVSNDQDLKTQDEKVRINEQDQEETINPTYTEDLSTDGQRKVVTDNQYKKRKSKKCQCFKRCPNVLIEKCLKKDEDGQVVALIKELTIYLIFLSLLSTIIFTMVGINHFYLTTVLKSLFLGTSFPDASGNLREAKDVDDFWNFAEHVMLDALYWDTWYNKKPTNGNERSILYVNRLLGAPRLRQLRVRNDSCTIPEEFKRAISDCYSVYSSNNEATQSYGVYDGTAWNYNSAEKLGGSNYWGTLAWYGKGGFYVDLGVNRSKTEEILMELKLYRWIDQATRAVFLDFTVYNANVNLFCVVRLVFEFPPTGGMIPSWNFETSKLIRYTSTNDFFIAGLEVIFVIFTLYYFVEELQELYHQKLEYLKNVWNIFDLLILCASINCIVFNIYRTFTVGYLLQGLLANPQNFPDFHGLSFGQIMFNYAVAVTIFLSWIRVFKYMSFNKTMMQLSLTLSRGAKDLFGFAVMFSIVFLAYAQLGYLMFGSQLIDFCSISSSIFTLLRVLLGDFDFYALKEIHGVLGPMFFLSYVFLVFFILMNMFLAIINDTYSQVKMEPVTDEVSNKIVNFVKKKWRAFKRKFTRKEQLKIVEETFTEILATRRTSHYDDVQREFKRRGPSEQHLKEVYETHDRDINLVRDEKEMQYAMSNIKETFEESIKSKEEVLNTRSQNLSRWTRRRNSRGRSFDTLQIETENQQLKSQIVKLENRIREMEERVKTLERSYVPANMGIKHQEENIIR